MCHVERFCAVVMPRFMDQEETGCNGEWSKPHDMAELSMHTDSQLWVERAHTKAAFDFSLDVISDLVFGRPLGLLTQPDYQWLKQALIDGNRYMYFQFAWPSLLKSKLSYWIKPSRWIFPKMAEQGELFKQLAKDFRRDREIDIEKREQRDDVLTALETALDVKTGEKMNRDEVWNEALTLIRAGKS